MYSDGVGPRVADPLSQVLLLSDLMEMASESHKDNVLKSYPLCHCCAILTGFLCVQDLIYLDLPTLFCDLNTKTLSLHTNSPLLPLLLDSFCNYGALRGGEMDAFNHLSYQLCAKQQPR